MLKSASRVLCAAIIGALMLIAARAEATMVSGVYVAREGGKAASRPSTPFRKPYQRRHLPRAYRQRRLIRERPSARNV